MHPANVYHTDLSMLLTVRRRLAALKVEARLLCAGVTRTVLTTKVHHTVLSMLLAVRGHPALEIEVRSLGAGAM